MLKIALSLVLTWWPSAITLAVIIYATLFPDPIGAEEVSLFQGADKLIHAIMMGGLTAAILFDRRRSRHILTRRFIVVTSLAVLAFSFIDEAAQGWMAIGRAADPADFAADAAGILLAALTAPPIINAIFRKN